MQVFNMLKDHQKIIKYSPVEIANIAIDNINNNIDLEYFAYLVKKYSPTAETKGPEKYLDYKYYIEDAIEKVCLLGLNNSKPLNILDIGSGPCYFLFVCKSIGHSILGLDLNTEPIYNHMAKLFNIPRIIYEISAYKHLPSFKEKLDLITAYRTRFNQTFSKENNILKVKVWREKEWDFFLKDLTRHLTFDGRVMLRINPHSEFNNQPFDENLLNFFLQKKAKVHDPYMGLLAENLA